MANRELQFDDGKSQKFWTISLKGTSHTVTFGKTGTRGQIHTKEFESKEKAKKSYDKLVQQKLAKGYVDPKKKTTAKKKTPKVKSKKKAAVKSVPKKPSSRKAVKKKREKATVKKARTTSIAQKVKKGYVEIETMVNESRPDSVDSELSNEVGKPANGFLADLSSDFSTFAHQFCGEHQIEGAICPNCDKPMLRMMSLDTTDPRLEFGNLGVSQVHLMFCWTCDLAQGKTTYALNADGSISLLAYKHGGVVETDFPYEDYPIAFPGSNFELTPSTEQRNSVPVTQIGGSPRFMHGNPDARCSECGKPMSYLATICDYTLDGRGFTGNEYVQVVFHLCPDDRVVMSYQECD